MQSVSNLVSDLWADLVITHIDLPFEKDDKKVKDDFLANCATTMDVGEISKEPVGNVLEEMCKRAGGDKSKCASMRKSWWEAKEANNLNAWCVETYDWFAAKTKPKCLSNCKALLCKERCKVDDKVKDLEDEIAALQIKLDVAEAKEKRLEEAADEQKQVLKAIEKRNLTKCIPAGENITKLRASQKSILEELDDLTKAQRKAEDEKEKALDILLKMKAQNDTEKFDVSKAQADFDKASENLKQARSTQIAKNQEAVEVQDNIAKAVASEKYQCEMVEEMKKEQQTTKATIIKEIEAVHAEKVKLEKAKADVVKLKDAALIPIKDIRSSPTTTAATTTPTTTTTSTNNKCECFHCGSNDPFPDADVCGTASSVCGPKSPDNSGCWSNVDKTCVCSTETVVQKCECFHCGGNDPFPQADICGAASSACGPNNAGNGCWTNVNANCKCDSETTTGLF